MLFIVLKICSETRMKFAILYALIYEMVGKAH